jgi:predicted phosphodiesterase
MELYITGDTHGDFSRFRPENFYEQEGLTKEDVVLVAGDFGGVWYGDSRDDARLDFLESRPFTTVFVPGNHENYDALAAYPQREWQGGRVRIIRPSVLMLERGQVFDLGGRTFFAMGGASSHDIQDGILEPDAPDFLWRFQWLNAQGAAFRVNHRSWWREEPARRNMPRPGPAWAGPGGRWTTSSPTARPQASRMTCWGRCPNRMPSPTFWRRSASGAGSSITSSDTITKTRSSGKNMCCCTSRSYG